MSPVSGQASATTGRLVVKLVVHDLIHDFFSMLYTMLTTEQNGEPILVMTIKIQSFHSLMEHVTQRKIHSCAL